jgi:hypothetical protein
MKKSFILVISILSILTFSCNKKTSTDTTSVPKPDYYQLKVGNYWIYQHFSIDSNGVANPENKWDSVYIDKDTTIRGNTYYKQWEPIAPGLFVSNFLRDSSGYLVSNSGRMLCSVDNFTDTIFVDSANKFLFMGYLKMTGKDSLVSVPSGTYPSITSREKVVPAQPGDPHPIRYSYYVYGKSIGRIKSHNFYYNADLHFEVRLVRYKIK